MLANILSDIISNITDWVDDISSNWWFPFVIFGIAWLDSVIPVVPSETTVIAGGVAAGAGDQRLALVILAGAAGAFVGDNIAYLIGRKFEPRVRRWAQRKPSRLARLDGAAAQIHKRGGPLLITARFIPGGRTILTVSSGLTEQPWRWFAPWIALASVIWATYAAGLGFAFGQAFEDNHNLAFLLAFGVALTITISIEVIRWVRERRKAGTEAAEASPILDAVD
jgi:membrane-associated protein